MSSYHNQLLVGTTFQIMRIYGYQPLMPAVPLAHGILSTLLIYDLTFHKAS